MTILPSSNNFSDNPDISKLVKFRTNSKSDLQLKMVDKLDIISSGNWDPEEKFSEDGLDDVPHSFDKILAKGERSAWEMKNILPGFNSEDFSCPIGEGIDILDSGDWNGAVRHMKGLLSKDERCLDAYAHLGNWHFEIEELNKAKNFYKMGVAIGLKSIDKKINDVFSWGLIDNRPFLRCLHGLGLTFYRQQKIHDAISIFNKMIWLNPDDNQGARFLIYSINDGIPWEECD